MPRERNETVEVGQKYTRIDTAPRQYAEVRRVHEDSAGIPHVHFTLFVERGTAVQEEGPRVLSATSFLKLYAKPN